MANDKLKTKQEMFCAEYIIDCNATQAAIRAGFSKKTAAQSGYENMKRPHVLKRIRQLQRLRSMRTQVTADRVIEEVAIIAFAQDGVKISYKLNALEKLMKHLGLFEKQENQPPDLILEYHESKAPPNGISEEDRRLFDAMLPMERQRIRRALRKQLAENETNEQETTTETGLEAGNNGDDEQCYIHLIGLMKEQLLEHRFREVMKKAGRDPDGHMSE